MSLNGAWLCDGELVASIKESLIVWADGTAPSTLSVENSVIRMALDGEDYEGKLVDSSIMWSDGESWTRADGRADGNIEDQIVACVQKVLGTEKGIHHDASLSSQGLTSQSMVHLTGLLAASFQEVDFPSTVLLEHPSVKELAVYIGSEGF
jgi:hypothetical protein